MTSALYSLLLFLAVAGFLILVHELGHLLAARLLGWRVVSFSLGFGPTLLSWEGGGTRWNLNLIPLGGAVRLGAPSRVRPAVQAGDTDPAETTDTHAPTDPGLGATELPPEADELASHPAAKRALLVLAGPVANTVAALLLMASGHLVPQTQILARVGIVAPGSPAQQAGLLPGDLIEAVEDDPAEDWPTLRALIAERAEQPTSIRLQRGAEELTLVVTPTTRVDHDPLGRTVTVGWLGVTPWFARPAPAFAHGTQTTSGLSNEDEIPFIDGQVVRRFDTLAQVIASPAEHVGVALRPRRFEAGPIALWLGDPFVFALVGPITELEPAAAIVGSVRTDSPAGRLGLRAGDVVTRWDGAPTQSLELRLAEHAHNNQASHTITWRRAGRSVEGELVPEPGREGGNREGTGLQAVHGMLDRHAAPRWSSPARAMRFAWRDFVDALRLMGTSAQMLVTGRLPLSDLGGPIFMAEAVRASARSGVHRFLAGVGFLSLYLGLLNLLPMAPLDGGTLAALSIESVVRRRFPRRLAAVGRFLGLLAIALLLILALRNDLGRYFPT